MPRPAQRACFALLAAGFLTACPPPCRTDLDCDSTETLQVCNQTDFTCEPLQANAPRVCSAAEDCASGRGCVDGECAFVPTCQTILNDTPFRYIASCSAGSDVTGVAIPTTTGCRVSFSLRDLLGGDQNLVIPSISAQTSTVSNLSTSDTSDLSCAGGGTWDGPSSSLVMSGCAVQADTCDVALSRQRASMRVCLDDAHCDPPQTCVLDVTAGSAGGGRCG